MRSLLFISPHFPPDSAAGTHRARILAPHLAAHGWRPIVLTVDQGSIEGQIDRELHDAAHADVEVIRVKAWPRKWTRRAGFGDLGLRSYRPLRRAAMHIARSKRVDATLVTTYPTYPAMIGAALKRSHGVPFVLDLQDPWVGAWGRDVGPGGYPDLRSRASRAVAVRLERHVATAADALISVTSRTMEELVTRIPDAAEIPQLELPIGWEPEDWERVRKDGSPNPLFANDGRMHLCAVGTLLPTAFDGLRAFLQALSHVGCTPESRQRLHVWFVGTSNERRDDAPATVRPLAAAFGVEDMVTEVTPRLAYFDALRVLRDAGAVLVLGSGEPHYTPSRVFPAIASRRPVIARLHRQSPASQLLSSASQSRPVHLIPWSNDSAGQTQAFIAALMRVMGTHAHAPVTNDEPLAPYSGSALARTTAALLERVCG